MAKQVICTFLLTLLCLHVVDSIGRGRSRGKVKKCEKMTIPLCKDIGYNLTYMPNKYGQNTQFKAGLIIHQFWPLVLMNCSPLLKHFLCSLYVPMCDPIYFKEIVPCRSFCEDVRDKCTYIMKNNGFDWPQNLQCEQFPTRKENNICMKPSEGFLNKTKTKNGNSNKIPTYSPKTVIPGQNNGNNINKHINHVKNKLNNQGNNNNKNTVVGYGKNLGNRGCGCTCKAPFIYPNKTIQGDLPPCVLPCKQFYFKQNQSNFVTFWLGLWSIIAFVGTLLTISTFLIDRSRFVSTERPIIIISFCYIIVAFGYIIRLVYGHESIACSTNTNLIRYSATGPAQCTAVFFMTYYFSNVAWIWWVVLSMIWFLSSGLRWPPHIISNYSQYFHFIAWIIPTVQTMAILAMSAIDGDPVSGLCSVGNHDNNTLTIFVIAPLLIYTMLSFSFFMAGLLAIFQRRRKANRSAGGKVTPDYVHHRQQCNQVSKIGIYTFMLFFPAFTLIGCYFYEHNNKEIWEKSTNCPCVKDKVRPIFYVYLLKYFMALVTGLVSGFWILDSRTLDSWKCFLLRFVKDECRENNNLLTHHKYNAPVQL